MPRYYPNKLINDCYGSVGSITFYHIGNKCFWKSKSTLTFSNTR